MRLLGNVNVVNSGPIIDMFLDKSLEVNKFQREGVVKCFKHG